MIAWPDFRTTLTRLRCLPALALSLALCGCAAQVAFRNGQDLIAQQQTEAGLAKLREATTREPDNPQYRLVYLRERERAIRTLLARGDREAGADHPDLARPWYLRVLALDERNDRAQAGLRALEDAARHAQGLAEAERAIKGKQYEPARLKLDQLLKEQPGDTKARALMRELSDKTPQATPDAALAQAFRKPISIEFRDAPLKQVFEVLARHSGLNFVFDKEVKADGKISIYLKNSNIESVLYYLLATNQLEQQVMDSNTVLIYPNTAPKVKEYQEMLVKTFFLNNADAKQVANTLKTILKTRDLVIDEKLNALIIRDSPEAIRLAERLVALQDMAEPEVVLELEVLEITRSSGLNLGVVWPSSATLTPLSTTGGTTLTLADLAATNRSTVGVSGVAVTVNAAKTDGDTKILANPRVRVRNKEKAKILIGSKVPVITTTISPGTGGFASESVSYIDVGLTLNVEPAIYLNNDVAIRVSLEVSNVTNVVTTKSGTTAYEIGTRQASTLLQLKDGENQVLAGLINNQERSSGNKVPGLGDIPILGRLFGSTQDDDTKTEIVLSITPHLVRNIERPSGAALEFQTGTETGFRQRPVAVPAESGKSAAAGAQRGPGVVLSGSADAATGSAAAGSASASFSAPSHMSRVGEFQPSPPASLPAAPPTSNPVNLSATQPTIPQGSLPSTGSQPVPPTSSKEK